MKKPKIIIFVLCVFYTLSSKGQELQDSVQLLNPVVINQSRLNDYVIGAYELPIDSATLSLSSNGSFTDLLRKHGFGHIRTYGPGGLATPSFRGTGSSHTAILWNGINLISPLSGQLDLSLVPAGLFEDASVQTGGATSLSGNGSIGANIHLNNSLNFNEGLRAGVSSYVGSFGSRYHDASFRFSNKKFGSSTKLFLNKADNDFKFTNKTVFPAEVQRRQHSAFDQHGILQQLHLQTKAAGIFSLKFWYQKSKYEIPNPTTILRISEATEHNEFYRALAGWNYSHNNFDLNYQGAFIQHDLDFADPVLNLYSVNRYKSTIQNIEFNFRFSKAQLTSGVNYTWEESTVDEFGEATPIRNRIAVFGACKIDAFEKWKFSFSGREEIVDGELMPFAPTISARYDITSMVHVFTNLSRNYRLPTFNDLYWKGAGAQGNPDIKSETSLSGEFGAGITRSHASVKIVAFTNHVDDWILWSPQDGQTWMPENIKKVWSRGIETQFSISEKFNGVLAKLTAQYSFTKSTNEDIYDNGNQNEKGKQLLLTPMHEASLTAEATWRKYNIRIVNAYTGEQFNDSDNTPYNVVEDYLITNIWLGKSIEQKRWNLTLTGEINNVFNVEYQGRPGYPMPGINYKAGFLIKLQ